MKTYTIEISGYPQEFTIMGNDKGEAILEAQRRWHDKMNGASIYETNVISEEEHTNETERCAGCLLPMRMRSDDSAEVMCGNRRCQFFKKHEAA